MDHTLRRTWPSRTPPIASPGATTTATWSRARAADAPAHAAGLQSFMREAQLLAGFDHPSLVKVHRFWKANGTAYMVMPHYAGRTLKEMQRTTGALRDEPSLRRLLHPLLCALEVLHDANVYHRDISPDNIVVLPDASHLLAGSARHVVTTGQALTASSARSRERAVRDGPDSEGALDGPVRAGRRHALHGHGTGRTAACVPSRCQPRPRIAAATASRCFPEAIDWALAVRPDPRRSRYGPSRRADVSRRHSFRRGTSVAATAVTSVGMRRPTRYASLASRPDVPRCGHRHARGVSLALCAAVWGGGDLS